jgi:cytochrome c553
VIGKSLLCLLVVVGSALACASPVSGHSVFKKKLSAEFPNKKVSCNACHDPKDKKIRNNFGKLLQKQFESKTLTADYKTKKGADKKAFEAAVLTPEFEKAFKKVNAMTVKDLIEAGFFDGVDNPEEDK